MAYYLRYATGMKKVAGGDSLLQLVLTWPSWAYHMVKPYWTQALPCSSLARLLWLKMTGVSLTLTMCAPWVLVIIDPCPCGFTRAFKCLTFVHFADSWMSKLTPHWSLFLLASLTWFGWSLIDLPNLLTSYPFIPSTDFRSMLRSTLLMCYACMGFRRRSFMIESHSLSLTFGSNSLELTWFTVWLITHSWMAKQRELTKF
jgi:hypothetical protein